MSTFKRGDAVRQVMPAPISGHVTGFDVDQETGVRQIQVTFHNGEETRIRFFAEGDLELTPDEANAEAEQAPQ